MQKWNLKYVLLYTAIIIAIVLSSFVFYSITEDENFIRTYQKFTFAVPVLFIIAAFLAFKIAEQRIVLISLSFLILSLSQTLVRFISAIEIPADGNMTINWLYSPGNWINFLEILPFILPFSLSLIFLIPEKIGRMSMTPLKAVIALLPLSCLLFPDYFEYWLLEKYRYGGVFLAWPSIAASLLPLSGPCIYRDRRSGTFSAALTFALIISMLPMMASLNGFLREISYLSTGIILLHSLYRVYWENSYIDELTGLFNRRAMDEKLRRLGRRFTLSMVDIDHFKNFNDTYGHDEGDNVLRLVAKILHTHFGKSAFRYGGEEFCIVFRKISSKSAYTELDQARAAIEQHGFSIRRNIKNRKKSGRKNSLNKTEKVRLTISAGIAASARSIRDAEAVLKNADKALYLAKENGRNRVEISRAAK